MSRAGSTEEGISFTGERVIPGAVESQLWNEHVSRYHFAKLFASTKQVLDVGCGAGYGTDLLAQAADNAIGFDVSPEAIQYAIANYRRPFFLLGSADAFPLPSQSCGLITAFEVIEHIARWPELIQEASRVLAPEGVFLVSTPNKRYYAETREDVGPNPFHVHEFEYQELERCLRARFMHVTMLSQNQSESIVFAGVDQPIAASAHIPPPPSLSTSHFFLAVCSHRPVRIPNFSFVSDSGNVLRDRERHIRILKEDVRETHEQHLRLLDFHNELHRELAERTTWGMKLDAQLRDHERESKAPLSKSDEQVVPRLARNGLAAISPTDELRITQARVAELSKELQFIRESHWLRLGKVLGVGPYNNRRFRPRAFLKSRGRRFLRATASTLQQWSVAVSEWALYLAAFPAVFLIAVSLLCVDACFALFGRRRLSPATVPRHEAATVIIPNWNGRDLLERFLPSVLAAVARCPGSELIVVDNASTDDSVAFIRANFPFVRVLSMPTNLGFAKAANQGAAAASSEVVVFLNSDMRVEPEFLSALLPAFEDPLVFAASSQIFLADPSRRREETGLTEVWWESGRLRVTHRADEDVRQPFPCAYPGGGSSACDRRKFFELGGFDSLFHPFYYEDTDLGRMAWTRGWKVLYMPASVVHHEHRGTIGKTFQPDLINHVVRKNSLLYGWKNFADWRALAANFGHCFLSLWGSKGKTPPDALLLENDARRLFGQLPQLVRSRWKARTLRAVSDREAFRRPLGGYFRDRFIAAAERRPARLNVLFAAPYPIAPPVHGGAVFMNEALAGLQRYADVHLVSFVDSKEQLSAQESLLGLCKTALFMVRPHVSLEDQRTLTPNAVREFGVRDFAWAIHRTMLLSRIDVVQLEYTVLGQYGEDYLHIPCILFEHDISAQSLRRRLRASRFDGDLLLEYVRMRMYEPRLLKKFTRVQVCSEANALSLLNLARAVRGKVDSDVRAGINVSRYPFSLEGREPDTLLFIGSFRHSPNVDALKWFIAEVLPVVLASRPRTILFIVGSDAPESAAWLTHSNIQLLGPVPDVKIPLQRYSVFLCPIQSGSGVRVKLLEAFAMGIPAVSTRIGAEGLAGDLGPVCEEADSPAEFASALIRLLANPDHRTELARRARHCVEARWDSREASDRLVATYNHEVTRLRTTASPTG